MRGKRVVVVSILLVIVLTLSTVVMAPTVSADEDEIDEDDVNISESEAMEIVEESGFDTPGEDADVSLRSAEGARENPRWVIRNLRRIRRISIDAMNGEINFFSLTPQEEESVIEDRSEAITTAEEELREMEENIEEINFSHEMLETEPDVDRRRESSVGTIPCNETAGWQIAWCQQVDDIPVRASSIRIGIAETGELVRYINHLDDFDEDEFDTEDIISEEEALNITDGWVSHYSEVNAELVIDRPTPRYRNGSLKENWREKMHEVDLELMHRLRFYCERGNFVQIEIDANTGEYLGMAQSLGGGLSVDIPPEDEDGGENVLTANQMEIGIISLIVAGAGIALIMKKKYL